MFDATSTDPLGIGLRSRAADYRTRWNAAGRKNGQQHGQLVSFGSLGPLSDPAFDALFQAQDEEGVDRTAGASAGPDVRYQGLPESVAGLGGQATGAFNGAAFGMPAGVPGSALQAIDRVIAAGGGGSSTYEDHDTWMAKHKPGGPVAIDTQRGTSGNNQTKRAR